jgi:hypothetical protein
VSEAAVERELGVVFPCDEFAMEVAGRFWIKASVERVAFPTERWIAFDNAVAEGTFLGTEEGGGPICLETENATRESGRFWASVGLAGATLLCDGTGICLRGAGVITAAENDFFSVARGLGGGTGVLASPG